MQYYKDSFVINSLLKKDFETIKSILTSYNLFKPVGQEIKNTLHLEIVKYVGLKIKN